ncbi:MAG: hypothetical protein AAGD38_18565 [Acidobacteriota bacterium]
MKRRTAWGLAAIVAIALLAGYQTTEATDQKGQTNMGIHYVEIVTKDVEAQIAAMEKGQVLSFGEPVADLGLARVAETPSGSLVGVRAPLAEHEAPIVRTYFEVENIAKAIEEAKATGAMVAYPPTQQGDTGTWAIYILGDAQIGLWQK